MSDRQHFRRQAGLGFVEQLRNSLRNGSRRGMSLVEIMVVITIIVTLMGIIGFGVMSLYEDARVQTTKLQMGEVIKRVELYQLKKKKAPGTSDGLAAVYGSADAVPKDDWGNPFTYLSPGPSGEDFDLISYGKDGSEGGTGNGEDIKWSERGTW